jgi:hypothetical protein
MSFFDRIALYVRRDYAIYFLERHTSREAQVMSLEKARRYESECRRLILTFWNLLNSNQVDYLSDITSVLGRAIEKTENVYRILLARTPSPQIYQAYSRFLDEIVNDPENARHFSSVGEQLQFEVPAEQPQIDPPQRGKQSSHREESDKVLVGNRDVELKSVEVRLKVMIF